MGWEDTVLVDDITKLADRNWNMNWRELCSAIDSDYRLDYEQYLLDVLQDTKKAQAKASYEAGVKAEHERVNKCIKFIKYDQDTIAIIDMMQFLCPEKCPKGEP